jgi:hypothetical protein
MTRDRWTGGPRLDSPPVFTGGRTRRGSTRVHGSSRDGQPSRDTTVAHGGAPALDPASTLGQDALSLGPSTSGPSSATDMSRGQGSDFAGQLRFPAVEVVIPMHLAPVGNRREHHLARARRTRQEIAAVLGALVGYRSPPLPVVVLLVRVGWNRLDVDGLVASVKGPIDALARWLGVDDRDPGLHWHLAQQVTRERRFVRGSIGHGRWETACALRIVVRPRQPGDGDDPLRVLAAAP